MGFNSETYTFLACLVALILVIGIAVLWLDDRKQNQRK